jgi:hypothetical protein
MSILGKISKYQSSPSTNPSVIYQLLFGSQQAVDSTSTIKNLTDKLSADFRKQIEANLPVFYLLDATEIVEGVLEDLLHPDLNSKTSRGLSKFISSLNCSDIDFVSEFGPTPNLDTDYYTEYDTKSGAVKVQGIEPIYRKVYNVLISRKQEIIREVHKGIKSNLTNPVSLKQVSDELYDSMVYINSTISDLVSAGVSQASITNASKVVSASVAGRTMRESFRKLPKAFIVDAHLLINGFDPNTMVLATAANYNLVTTDNHNAATKAILKFLKNVTVSNVDLEHHVTGLPISKNISISIVPTAEFKVGNVVAAGHAAVKSSNKGIIGINTPALQIALAILQANNRQIPGIAQAFVNEVGHAPYAIEINTDYEDFTKNLFNLQVSFLRSQRTKINSGKLSANEVSFFDNIFKEALNKSYKEILNDFRNKVKSGSVGTFIVEKFARSPTLLQSLSNKLVSTIVGDNYKGPKSSLKDINKELSLSNIKATAAKKGSVNKLKGRSLRKPNTAVPELSRAKLQQVSLVNLQILLDATLVQRVKQNMGSGNSKTVLNLRSGRLAESVSVERLSESRAGMITAFYSYMKNPYATFSDGGQQQYPKSRDPKLLISKSIREIAAQQVGNRLRAVNI